jgi:hypothetical protein
MNALTKRIGFAAILVGSLLACGFASAAVVMDFELPGAQNGEYVDNYYDGGCGSSYGGGPVDCGGPNYGAVWSGAIACGAPVGLCVNVANEPSPSNVMVFLDSSSAIMNVAAGFDTGFSFYYAAPNTPGVVTVYDGLNGTGNVLATIDLGLNGSGCGGAPQAYSCWTPIGVSFLGTAMSVDFGGTANFIVYDDVTIGSATPGQSVPEPAALGMFGFGALLVGLFAGLRRRAFQS